MHYVNYVYIMFQYVCNISASISLFVHAGPHIIMSCHKTCLTHLASERCLHQVVEVCCQRFKHSFLTIRNPTQNIYISYLIILEDDNAMCYVRHLGQIVCFYLISRLVRHFRRSLFMTRQTGYCQRWFWKLILRTVLLWLQWLSQFLCKSLLSTCPNMCVAFYRNYCYAGLSVTSSTSVFLSLAWPFYPRHKGAY
jgi:hypothetical protein